MMKKLQFFISAFCIIISALSVEAQRPVTSNLLVNAHFAKGTEFWKVDFPTHDFMKNNIKDVSVVKDGNKDHVLRFFVSEDAAWITGQGIHALSWPVKIDNNKRYRLTVTARTTAPNARIYLYGKKMRPDAKADTVPTPDTTRNVLKGSVMSFTGEDGTAKFSNVPKTWTTQSVEIPRRNMTQQEYKFWKDVQFLEVHLVGIGGSEGYIYFDDIRVEEVGAVTEKDITVDGKYAPKVVTPGVDPNTGKKL